MAKKLETKFIDYIPIIGIYTFNKKNRGEEDTKFAGTYGVQELCQLLSTMELFCMGICLLGASTGGNHLDSSKYLSDAVVGIGAPLATGMVGYWYSRCEKKELKRKAYMR
jgi:hypothetical protein